MYLEKNAIKSGFIKRVMLQNRKGGIGGAIDYIRKFKDPTHALPLGKANVPKKIETMVAQKGKANLSRGVRTSMGNMAENAHILTKDIKGKGIIAGTGQALKNTGELLARQVKGDTVKEIAGQTTVKDGKRYLLSQNPLFKDREVMSETGRGTFLVRKRKAILPVSVALGGSGASIGAASYMLSDKTKPKSKRLQTAARDTALFTAGIPIGIAGSLALGSSDSSVKIKKNKNKIGE